MDRMNQDRVNEMPPALRAALQALDARAGRSAERVDVERVAARVLERLRREGAGAEGPRRVWWTAPASVRVAAAVVVLAVAGLVARISTDHGQRAAALRLPVGIAVMDSLSSGQLEAVLEAAGDVRPAADSLVPLTSSGSLDDLSEAQLETLLASLSGAEG